MQTIRFVCAPLRKRRAVYFPTCVMWYGSWFVNHVWIRALMTSTVVRTLCLVILLIWPRLLYLSTYVVMDNWDRWRRHVALYCPTKLVLIVPSTLDTHVNVCRGSLVELVMLLRVDSCGHVLLVLRLHHTASSNVTWAKVSFWSEIQDVSKVELNVWGSAH